MSGKRRNLLSRTAETAFKNTDSCSLEGSSDITGWRGSIIKFLSLSLNDGSFLHYRCRQKSVRWHLALRRTMRIKEGSRRVAGSDGLEMTTLDCWIEGEQMRGHMNIACHCHEIRLVICVLRPPES